MSWADIYERAVDAVKSQRRAASRAVPATRAGQPVPTPRQLPPRSPQLVGRDREFAELDRHHRTARAGRIFPSVVIGGRAGIGKTALAVGWGHIVRKHYLDGQLFIHVNRPGIHFQTSLDGLCGQLLRGLGVPAERIPANVEEQLALYRSVTSGKALLVILDDVVSCRQVIPFLLESPGMVVATSRHRLDGMVGQCGLRIRLRALSEEASIDLVRTLIGEEAISKESSSVRDLVQLCDRLPLALCIAAAQVRPGRHHTIAGQVAKLQDEQRRLAHLSIPDSLSVRASLDISYRELSSNARQLYFALSLHPGEYFPGELASALTVGKRAAADQAMEDLVEASLLEETDEGGYAYADLIRLHARQKLSSHAKSDEIGLTKTRIIEWFLLSTQRADSLLTPYRETPAYCPLHPVTNPMSFADRNSALFWLDTQRHNLMAVTRMADELGLHEATWHLCNAQWSLFLYRRHYLDRLKIDQLGVKNAKAWGSSPAEADMLKRLGRLCGLLGRFGRAIRLLEKAIEISRSCGAQLCEADALTDLGRVFCDVGHSDRADRLISQATEIYRAVGDDRRLALAQINTGLVQLKMGDGDAAVAQLQQALSSLDQYRNIDPYNRARALIALARALVHVGRHADATGHLIDGSRIMSQYDSQYRLAEVSVLHGQIAEAMGDSKDAVRRYDLALRSYLALGADEARLLEMKIATLNKGV